MTDVESPHLQGLIATFLPAKEARARARNQVRLMEEYLTDLERAQRVAQDLANANQRSHDQAHGLYERCLVAERHEKAWQKARKRDAYGDAAKAARVTRDECRALIADGKQQLVWLKKEVDIRSKDAYYYRLRHQMMLAREEHERGNPDALETKRLYMKCANIPENVSANDVLYYTDGRNVHLFYGGGKDFYGTGTSPDGVGHGHVMLTLNRQNRYCAKFSRLPGE